MMMKPWDLDFLFLNTLIPKALNPYNPYQPSWQATTAEQYVTLEIPSELISTWKREGYTHLHHGGVRLILTLHGRKGLPVMARIALLDTRFKQYQHAIIGTVLTTLHAGSALLTFYPNFNLSLLDSNLATT